MLIEMEEMKTWHLVRDEVKEPAIEDNQLIAPPSPRKHPVMTKVTLPKMPKTKVLTKFRDRVKVPE